MISLKDINNSSIASTSFTPRIVRIKDLPIDRSNQTRNALLHQKPFGQFPDYSITTPTTLSSLLTNLLAVNPILTAPIYFLSFLLKDLFSKKT